MRFPQKQIVGIYKVESCSIYLHFDVHFKFWDDNIINDAFYFCWITLRQESFIVVEI